MTRAVNAPADPVGSGPAPGQGQPAERGGDA